MKMPFQKDIFRLAEWTIILPALRESRLHFQEFWFGSLARCRHEPIRDVRSYRAGDCPSFAFLFVARSSREYNSARELRSSSVASALAARRGVSGIGIPCCRGVAPWKPGNIFTPCKRLVHSSYSHPRRRGRVGFRKVTIILSTGIRLFPFT